jgi:hypothetical protein
VSEIDEDYGRHLDRNFGKKFSRPIIRSARTMGSIYFITMEPDEYVKIGWALNGPAKRLSELQCGCPHPLRLMAYAPGTLDEEKILHKLFADLRHRGEWFLNRGPLAALIELLSDDHPRPTQSGADRQSFIEAVSEIASLEAAG